ncbi:HAD-IA family hydrolase [Nocardia beijingensis]|uniref:HAD family hydrolase n=1 Tax=Nocardia beijingensis TaxID=95162 RepID=UPI0018933291|nr:HAD-IA family hydrolase [Nocardia beijingensis]MBF6463786.1 HAD-IA family hydrolase [Nocardia beijingensis]
MAIEAVLFDFSGTLFRLEADESWYADLAGPDGRAFDVDQKAEIMRRMTAPVDHVADFDDATQYAWDHRDLDPALHRKVMMHVLRESGVPTDEDAERLYARLLDPLEWTPYPDSEAVLDRLAAQEIPVAVVSNIPFDIRPSFAARGWDRLVGVFTLSFEVGAMKPDPEIFHSALGELGVPAEAALMIGDSAEADGGAEALGSRFALVEALPTAERPDALLAALRRHGLMD